MTTSYKTVFERFLGSIDDPMLLRLDYNSLLEFIRDWLHAAASNPRFRHKFKTFSMDDELMTITYELNFRLMMKPMRGLWLASYLLAW